MEDPEHLLQAALSSGLRVYEGLSLQLPQSATEVTWTSPSRTVDPYGFIDQVLTAGVAPEAVRVFLDAEESAGYWTVDLADGRSVLLTDCTEDYVSWMEGPWPWAATFTAPDSARTEVDFSLDQLITRIFVVEVFVARRARWSLGLRQAQPLRASERCCHPGQGAHVIELDSWRLATGVCRSQRPRRTHRWVERCRAQRCVAGPSVFERAGHGRCKACENS
jgi:hypothetical protein